MNITIHCEPSGGAAIGGAELSVATLAHALSDTNDVRLVHHRARLTAATLAAFSSLDLSRVDVEYVPLPATTAWSCSASRNPLTRYREASAWQAELSADADVFITFTHGIPPFCHARRGILVVLFPLFRRWSSWPWIDEGPTSRVMSSSRRAYYDWEWRRRFASYDVTLSISEFVREWTTRWWSVDTEVVYPPVNVDFAPRQKRRSILSVGRFSAAGLNKKHIELVHQFAQLRSSLPGWQYTCAGALGTDADDLAYFTRVRTLAAGVCHMAPNLSWPDLRAAYSDARVFWHAAGFGEAERLTPEWSEHFGIATVEAMAAGCVPVVCNTGGQREIVEHGINGFLWNSMDDLARYTRALASDDAMWRRMSAMARLRAGAFSRARFVSAFSQFVQSPATVQRRA